MCYLHHHSFLYNRNAGYRNALVPCIVSEALRTIRSLDLGTKWLSLLDAVEFAVNKSLLVLSRGHLHVVSIWLLHMV